MEVLDIDRAHVAGVSLGAAAGMWLAAKYPERVASLSLHSAWAKTDAFLAVVGEGLAGHGSGPRERARDGDPGHLPVVLHA